MFCEEQIDNLCHKVKEGLSEKRFRHTVAVADMAMRLGELFVPDKCSLLRVAGLLHDITKEYSTEKQLQILNEFGIMISKQDILTPKTLHARTAALLIPVLYPEFADPLVIDAVRYHTTGHQNMTITEKIIYFADYIDDTRTFEDCIMLRNSFFDAQPQNMDMETRLAHFRKLLILSFDKTIESLLEKGSVISEDTLAARNSLILEGERANL